MAWRKQNANKWHDRVPGFYANNRLYPGSYTQNEAASRTSRRIHDGLSLTSMYGLDIISDDINSSQYSSPYYINGRYNGMEETAQRGSASSVQGIKRLLVTDTREDDFDTDDIQASIRMKQGTRIKFELPYDGKIVGNTLSIKNTDGCSGILSFYLSATDGGEPIYETAVDLCKVSRDKFEHVVLYSATAVPARTTRNGRLYASMEIWDEISMERSGNPFNTGREIEIAATGLNGREECYNQLDDKNMPIRETYNYTHKPNRPLVGLIYSDWGSVPTNRVEESDYGATVSLNGFNYDLFVVKNATTAKMLIYDRSNNNLISNSIKVDGRTDAVNLVQAKDYVYYVDGYSPLQKFKIGVWNTYTFPSSKTDNVTVSVDLETFEGSGAATDSGLFLFVLKDDGWYFNGDLVSLATYGISISGDYVVGGRITVTYAKTEEDVDGSATATYEDSRPVLGPSIITKHYNRIYLSGFTYDHNLVQCTEIDTEGPQYDSYLYRFYVPDKSPLATSDNKVTAFVTYENDTLMIASQRSFSLWNTNAVMEGDTSSSSATPSQVSLYNDGGGVQSTGDITCYQGVIYSFDQDEGVRRFTGATWSKLPAAVDSYVERVDMTKPRKLWAYANKLYFNYTDRLTNKAMCLIWDKDMNYQQVPWFVDQDIPFTDIRSDDDFTLIGIHPDFPCIMNYYTNDVWARLDTPITFERWTKSLSLPGNSSDMILKRLHLKVLANSNRIWNIGISKDDHSMTQNRNKTVSYRLPCWDTIDENAPVEDLFSYSDPYQEDCLQVLSITNLRIAGVSVQIKIKCKTFRNQASLSSVLLEAQPKNII